MGSCSSVNSNQAPNSIVEANNLPSQSKPAVVVSQSQPANQNMSQPPAQGINNNGASNPPAVQLTSSQYKQANEVPLSVQQNHSESQVHREQQPYQSPQFGGSQAQLSESKEGKHHKKGKSKHHGEQREKKERKEGKHHTSSESGESSDDENPGYSHAGHGGEGREGKHHHEYKVKESKEGRYHDSDEENQGYSHGGHGEQREGKHKHQKSPRLSESKEGKASSYAGNKALHLQSASRGGKASYDEEHADGGNESRWVNQDQHQEQQFNNNQGIQQPIGGENM